MKKVEKKKEYAIKNKDKISQYHKNYYDENKEKYFIFVLLDQPYPVTIEEKILVSVLDYNFKLSVKKE